MKQASAFSVINNRGSLRLQEPKMEQTLRQRCIPADHKGLFAMLRRGERAYLGAVRYLSMAAAAPRPSAMAQTTRLWPRRASPAAKIPGIEVI